MTDPIRDAISASIETKQKLLDQCVDSIQELCDAAVRTLKAGGKLMFCGNGGSSCDASHAVGELVGWFEHKERPGYAAIALGHEVPTLTAVGNDAGYEFIFSRQVEALGRPEDLLIGISTSGGSKNVAKAMESARAKGIATAALASNRGGRVVELADVAIQVPSSNTARIQECHLVCVHILCAAVENAMAGTA